MGDQNAETARAALEAYDFIDLLKKEITKMREEYRRRSRSSDKVDVELGKVQVCNQILELWKER